MPAAGSASSPGLGRGVRGWTLLSALVALCGVVVASMALPAAGQSIPPPVVTMTGLSPPCSSGESYDIIVRGTSNRGSNEVQLQLLSPSGAVLGTTSTSTSTSGAWSSAGLSFNESAPGLYEVRASLQGATSSGFIEVPCQAPTLEFQPTCFPVGYSGRVAMIGRHFRRFEAGHLVEYDRGGAEADRSSGSSDNQGVVRGFFTVTPSSRAHPGRIQDANGGLVADGTWSPCPPGPTTTTSTTALVTTTTAPPDDTVPDETTTTRPPAPDIPGTPVTIPPTIDLPPPTPGATLTVAPELGPAGFVAGATGSGFPPGAVTLTWSPGIGTTTAIVGPDGTFAARILVFPNDRIGPRALIATGGATTAFDAFLVVQSSVQPSGRNVQQINRIRRFNQR